MKLAFIPNCLKIILFRDSVEEYHRIKEGVFFYTMIDSNFIG